MSEEEGGKSIFAMRFSAEDRGRRSNISRSSETLKSIDRDGNERSAT
jgi:hypothetical protein